jgi:helix-turn-helix protein
MSFDHINWVRDNFKHESLAVRHLVLCLATRADDNGLSFPGYETLSKDTGMKVRSLRRLLDQIPKDVVQITPGGSVKGQPRRPTKYRILIPDHAPDAQGSDGKKVLDRAPDAHSAHANGNDDRARTVPTTVRVQSSTVRVQSLDRAPDAHLTVLTDSNSKEVTVISADAQVCSKEALRANTPEKKGDPSTSRIEQKAALTAKNGEVTNKAGLSPLKLEMDTPVRGRKKKAAPKTVIVPPALQIPEFLAAWSEWKAERKEKKIKPYTTVGETQQLRHLSEIGAERAIKAIEYSIRNGYQGLVEPKGEQTNGNQHRNEDPERMERLSKRERQLT